MKLKYTYFKFRTYINIISKDLSAKFPLPWHKKVKMWYNGFLAEKYALYQLETFSHKLFLSDFHTSMARWINEPFNDLLTNKYLFAAVVGKYIRTPETYGFISSGRYYPENKVDFEELLEQLSSLVLKPVTGGGGQGVHLIKKVENNFKINGKESLTKDELYKLISSKDNYIVTEYIEQGAFQRALYTHSTNTMRVLTLIDPETRKPFIVRAVQRVGSKGSEPQDNFTKGGLSFNINLENGSLSDGTIHPYNNKHVRYSHHPVTLNKIEGLVIPDWDKVKEEILCLAGQLPMLKCVGWDFLLTGSGLVAIEGNHHPDPDVLQGHGPLLHNKEVVKFYKYHKVLK
jgi:hypothetical protein